MWRQLAAGLGVRVDAGLESSYGGAAGTDPHGLPGCRDGMDGVHRRREMDGGWRPPAESMLPPLQTGLDLISAQACARRCVQRAGRLAGWLWVDMGRREPSRRSPSTQDMHVNHVGRTGWAGGRCGGVAATLRGSGEHARWPSGWVPEDARPEVLPIVPRPLPRTAPAQHAYVPGAHGKFNAHVVRRVLHTH